MSHFFSASRNRRRRILNALKQRLERTGWPRFQMTLIVVLTGTVWFLSGYLMLRAGLRVIYIRYAAALGCAYVAFVLLIWFWLWRERCALSRPSDGKAVRTSASSPSSPGPERNGHGPGLEHVADAADLVDLMSAAVDAGRGSTESVAAESASSGAEGLAAGAADGEGCIIVVVGAVALSALIAAGYIVYISPILFAEVLLDGALSVGLRRRIGRIEERHWLESAVAQTWIPFAIVLVLLVVAGAMMHRYAPEAATLGEVLGYSGDSYAQ